jgi:hypothetical protein
MGYSGTPRNLSASWHEMSLKKHRDWVAFCGDSEPIDPDLSTSERLHPESELF